jgi:hypothetical protein
MNSYDDFAIKQVNRLAFENGRFRQLLLAAIESMDYAQVFLCSREQMDDSRRSRWVSLLNQMAAAIEETEHLGNESAKLVGGE